ncbi:hypothetical protein FHR83_007014 [Actinoplanes campanulatus]|uniref:Uncharacterized protein n=1 Tax=Actinoplanes campanulatus TaxID=113559 RepID=A0A7W5FI36_9ACTN|nr:hypothetical protein [Actinoplanes campanulatus]MBB3099308.1 hypothetical protein [Actinoplanes campanulatus]GGN40536.1 hypothetical protein GCM10010109_69770 [Actinoplanes campanulatus]GID40626.1 hypothetical protein Aca09nite_71320 [Actinoplanes campanulatus]
MATTLKTVVTAQIDAVYKNVLDLGTPTDSFLKKTKIELSEGTGANSADRMFHDQRTINASSSEDLDLAGVLAGPFGNTLTFVELRAILISASSSNTNNVRVTRPASNGVPLFLAASDGIDIPPGGVFMWACPADGKVTVTASTGDLLTVANSSSGTSVTYDVVIIGTSA